MTTKQKGRDVWTCRMLIGPGRGATGVGSTRAEARAEAKRMLREGFGTSTPMRGGESFDCSTLPEDD